MSLIPSQTALSPQALLEMINGLVAATLSKKVGVLKPDDRLFSDQAGFDSFSLMEFVLRLEDTFGISIPDEDLDPDIFHSIKTITAYVQTRLEQGR
jgi:acyl carrier protein